MRPLPLVNLFVLLAACRATEVTKDTSALTVPDDTGPTTTDTGEPDDTADTGLLVPVDADGDGYPEDVDCDDGDATVHPDAEETCDGRDEDCNGEVDEGLGQGWYLDEDGDGYGQEGTTTEACAQPAGWAAQAGDCDDDDNTVFPGAGERCDGLDNDCDGTIDEDLLETWYADADGDGFGDGDAPRLDCDPGPGFIAGTGDCDDANSGIHPDATEVCDGLDNDCDGLVDDQDDGVTGTGTWYTDADGDGWGLDGTAQQACQAPAGTVTTTGDCNDEDQAFHPGADESDCTDPVDYNCDGSVAWADADGDGSAACEDCDDADAAVFPGATETCNELDDDCDGSSDEDDAADAATWYQDGDGDGYGDPASSTTACTAPSGYIADSSDCDDGDDATFPGATESCNGIDDDCDGTTDEDDAADAAIWYQDGDGDGYGDAASTTTACTAPSGTLADNTDCDDADAAIYPGALEACDGLDSDCSGALSWLEEDPDGDGLLACEDSLWLQSDGAVNNDPDYTSTYGSSQAAALLGDLGVSFDATTLNTTTLSASLLDGYGVLVLYGQGTYGPLDAAEAAALQDWVEDGGSLLYLAYHPYASTCAMVDSLPTAFGLACSDYSSYWAGCASNVVSHALTDGVSQICGTGGEHWIVSAPAQVLVDEGTWPVVAAVEPGSGRVVGVSDEWFLYNAGSGPSYDISAGDNQVFVENVWSWLTDFAL